MMTLNKSSLTLALRLLDGDRQALAKAITLIESTAERHRTQAEYFLDYVLVKNNARATGHTVRFSPPIRLGVAGPPGAGKSTLIERLGKMLTSQGLKVGD
jgi:LAO/AO transport system kinase